MNVLKEFSRNSQTGLHLSRTAQIRLRSASSLVRFSTILLDSSQWIKANLGCQERKVSVAKFTGLKRLLAIHLDPENSELHNAMDKVIEMDEKREFVDDNSAERSFSWRNFESKSSYKIMQQHGIYSACIVPPIPESSKAISTIEVLQLLNKNWSDENLEEFTKVLELVGQLPKQSLKKETCAHLLKNIHGVLQVPPRDKHQSITFLCALTYIDSIILSNVELYPRFSQALDTYCQALLPYLSTDEIFRTFHCYRLIGNPGLPWQDSFPQCALSQLEKQISSFRKSHLVQLCYFISICRKRITNMKKLQHYVEKHMENMHTDELAMATLAFFKTNVRITSDQILNQIMKKVKQEPKNISNATLAMITKSLRYHHISIKTPIFLHLLKRIRLEELSIITFGHLTHYGAAYLIYQEVLVKEIKNRLSCNIRSIRLKEINKLMSYISRIGYFSEHANIICEMVMDHLRSTVNTNRASEINRFQVAFVACLMSLSCMNKYDPVLLDVLCNLSHSHKINLDKSDIFEIWYIDRSVAIDFPQYKGSILPQAYRNHMAEESAKDCIPTTEQYHYAEFASTVVYTLKNMFGCRSCVLVGRVLPQYINPNIIVCLDNTFQSGIPISKDFLSESLIEPRYVTEKDLSGGVRWLAFELLFKYRVIYDTDMPYGINQARLRHLRSLGYIPFTITENDWAKYTTALQRRSYVSKLISSSTGSITAVAS